VASITFTLRFHASGVDSCLLQYSTEYQDNHGEAWFASHCQCGEVATERHRLYCHAGAKVVPARGIATRKT
jgi:hypothetical protein